MEIGNVKNKSHFFRKKSQKNSLQDDATNRTRTSHSVSKSQSSSQRKQPVSHQWNRENSTTLFIFFFLSLHKNIENLKKQSSRVTYRTKEIPVGKAFQRNHDDYCDGDDDDDDDAKQELYSQHTKEKKQNFQQSNGIN